MWGGPNGDLSLAEARRNFRDHLTMSRAEDTRCEDSPTEVQAKRAIIGRSTVSARSRLLTDRPLTPE